MTGAIERICEGCGGTFRRERSARGRFCTPACFYAHKGPDTKPRKPRRDRGPSSAMWKGGRRVNDAGFVLLAAGTKREKREHIVTVEQAIGHALQPCAVVHHVNRVRSDNRNGNLAVLMDTGEHAELHRKMRVRAAGGNPWTDRLCSMCRTPKPSDDFYWSSATGRFTTSCITCSRRTSLTRARKKSGIPLDAPLQPQGKRYIDGTHPVKWKVIV